LEGDSISFINKLLKAIGLHRTSQKAYDNQKVDEQLAENKGRSIIFIALILLFGSAILIINSFSMGMDFFFLWTKINFFHFSAQNLYIY
jgi:hypothetical protein